MNEILNKRYACKQMNGKKIASEKLNNILEAIQGTRNEANTIYPEYARIATEEGYNEIASLFNGIANISLSHELRLTSIANDIESDSVFCKEGNSLWICTVCGNIMGGRCAPEI